MIQSLWSIIFTVNCVFIFLGTSLYIGITGTPPPRLSAMFWLATLYHTIHKHIFANCTTEFICVIFQWAVDDWEEITPPLWRHQQTRQSSVSWTGSLLIITKTTNKREGTQQNVQTGLGQFLHWEQISGRKEDIYKQEKIKTKQNTLQSQHYQDYSIWYKVPKKYSREENNIDIPTLTYKARQQP